jgi:D-sedoheptulose 7-phosphate isomerase
MIDKKIKNTIENLNNLLSSQSVITAITETANVIVKSIQSDHKLMTCGNGGSAGDAQHIAGEFLCRFYKDRNPMPCIALTTDTSVLTSISNDYNYDQVFSRQVIGLGKHGDILLGISTSGSSKNVLEAFKTAKAMNITTILLTGAVNKSIAAYSDIIINAPSTDTPFIQEMHLVVEHIICEIVEKEINP